MSLSAAFGGTAHPNGTTSRSKLRSGRPWGEDSPPDGRGGGFMTRVGSASPEWLHDQGREDITGRSGFMTRVEGSAHRA